MRVSGWKEEEQVIEAEVEELRGRGVEDSSWMLQST